MRSEQPVRPHAHTFTSMYASNRRRRVHAAASAVDCSAGGEGAQSARCAARAPNVVGVSVLWWRGWLMVVCISNDCPLADAHCSNRASAKLRLAYICLRTLGQGERLFIWIVRVHARCQDAVPTQPPPLHVLSLLDSVGVETKERISETFFGVLRLCVGTDSLCSLIWSTNCCASQPIPIQSASPAPRRYICCFCARWTSILVLCHPPRLLHYIALSQRLAISAASLAAKSFGCWGVH